MSEESPKKDKEKKAKNYLGEPQCNLGFKPWKNLDWDQERIKYAQDVDEGDEEYMYLSRPSPGQASSKSKASPKRSKTWVSFQDSQLTREQHEDLEYSCLLINHNVVNYAQKLLHNQYPGIGGFQSIDVIRGGKMKPESGKFVQILVDSNNHYFVVSNVFCQHPNEAIVYDSHSHLRKSIRYDQELLTDITQLMTLNKLISKEATQQRNDYLSGAMAIAFAELLCHGDDPCKKLITRQSKVLRSHLIRCLEQGFFEQFPCGQIVQQFNVKKKRKKVEGKESDSLKVLDDPSLRKLDDDDGDPDQESGDVCHPL